jgi:hypothetical protein
MKIAFVRAEGLEPTCLAAPDPKSGMSTNSTTPALGQTILLFRKYRNKTELIIDFLLIFFHVGENRNLKTLHGRFVVGISLDEVFHSSFGGNVFQFSHQLQCRFTRRNFSKPNKFQRQVSLCRRSFTRVVLQ